MLFTVMTAQRAVLAYVCVATSASVCLATYTHTTVDVVVDGNAGEDFDHFWSKGVGSGHAALTTRADWRQHMKLAHDEAGFDYVRYHAVLDDTSMYTNAPANKNRQSYFDAISTYSYLISIGVRPVVELSFTPSPLVNGTCHHFYYEGCEIVPNNFELYYEYVYNFTSTLVDFFGTDEVENWYFEVYNEADLHWSFDDYFKLYRQAATAVHAVSSKLRIGGPATAFPVWVGQLVQACKNYSVPLDFVSSHAYPTTGGARNAEVKGLVTQVSRAAENSGGHLPILITEWNGVCNSRGPWHDETAQAGFIVAAIDAISAISPKPTMFAYWAVSDVFTEQGLPADPDPVAFHGGFGLISLYGIPKPGFRTFSMLNGAGDWRLSSSVVEHGGNITGSNTSVIALLNKTSGQLRIFTASHGYFGEDIPNRTVTVQLKNFEGQKSVYKIEPLRAELANEATMYRVDNSTCNPKRLWESWGSPNYLHAEQIQQLTEESNLKNNSVPLSKHNGEFEITFVLPAFGLVVLDIQTSPSTVSEVN